MLSQVLAREHRLPKIVWTVLKLTVCVGAAVSLPGAQTISFEPVRSVGLEAPVLAGPSCLATGDFNGDGRPDLIASNASSDNLSLLLGNGDGTFRTPTSIAAPKPGRAGDVSSVRLDRCLAAADLNHDGRLDVAVVNGESDSILVWFGNGDGSFRQPVVLSAGVRCY
ncbi:MAG TPA: VCBS repeat-containing protein, partial [Bryobacteraceae bacterium]